ncbi:DUF2141 domain-containing protein [Leptospira ognonensis]|uniref:DUF2141 domain-containing protein n=1 Tax=Leptospira ognonensis TaxID=2484945 RepID=A0A4R9KAX0_9LEPT|nr:DUF2141 domain-containing protein [Leptospira ognonensis]TGL61954.1 DUF2141 domain-containing protein [Leptospira ognonensis]
MKKTGIVIAGFLAIFQSQLQAIDLDVEVQRRISNSSIISCAIFESADGFPSDSSKRLLGVIAVIEKENKPICKFKGLALKKYAVAVLEDLNGNGGMDKTMIGMPKEPWGVSNNAPMHTFGPPTFEEASFQLTTNKTIQIKLNP